MADAREALAAELISAYPNARSAELRGEVDATVDAAEEHGLEGAELEAQIQSWVVQLSRRQAEWVSAQAALADLHCLLVGPISWWGHVWRALRRFAAFASAHWAPFLTVVVGVAGAFYGVAYAHFYARLDVTPEQVGLAPTQIVTQSVIGGVVLVLLVLLGIFCIALPMIPMTEKTADAKSRAWIRVLLNGILSLIGFGVLVALLSMAGFAVRAVLLSFLPIAVFFFVWASFTLSVGRWWVRIRPAALDFSADRYGVVLTACAIPALLVTVLATFTVAEELGEEASVGKAVRDPKIGIFPLLGVRAEPALVTWKHPTNSVSPTSCMLYLGSSEGKTTLYDHRRSSTFHIPADELTLQIKSEMSSCEAPTNVRAPSTHPHGEEKLRCERGSWHSRMDPKYTFEWVLDGHPLEDDGSGKPWLLYERGFFEGSVVYCKVKAKTPLGEDIAISAPAVVGQVRPIG